jgi:ABC-type multidrug transport system fused ATPase/permease subunit
MKIYSQSKIKTKIISKIPFVVLRSIKILTNNQKQKIFLVVLIQSSLGLLDLAGVAAVGLVGALAVTGVQSKVPGNRVGQVLNILNLENLTIQKQVAILGLLAAILFVLRTIFSIILSRKILYFLARCGAKISGNLVEKMLTQPLTLIQMKSSQETLYALTNGVSAITLGVIGSFTNILTDLTLLIIITTGLIIVDPIMAIVTIAFFMLVAFILYLSMSKRALKLGELNGVLSIQGNQKILEVLNSYREALIKNRRSYYANQIRESRTELANITAEYSFMPNISKYVIEASLILGAVLISAIQFILQDASHAVATLGVFMAAGSRLAPAILRIQSSAIQARVSSGSAIPTLDLIDLLSDVNTNKDEIHDFTSNHKDFVPRIDIRKLQFTYPGADLLTLNQVSISIDSGELVAITGPSGAGKTTLIDCVIGALIPDNGEIFISGKPPLEAISNWPGAIGYVPQDVVILNGTIKDNIIFGFSAEDIPEDLIYDALRKAHLFDHVSDLQNGINSYVGDKGTSLSGGQRQRLGIARALVSKPKLLILDEATSSLDGKSEADISDSINEFRGEVTTLIIAHRLSTIRNADKVIYMNKGKIEFIGTFDEVRKNVPEFDNQAKLMGL